MTRAWVLTVTRMLFVIQSAVVYAKTVTKETEGVVKVNMLNKRFWFAPNSSVK